jgi:polyisoprenoid-binding protein YceI
MKYLITFYLLFLFNFNTQAQTYSAKEVYIHFFSPAPIADIEAITNAAFTTLNIDKKELEIELKVSDFKFKKALMQAHFNEKYIESDKYPNSSFKGKFKENLNLEKDGIYTINLDGKFSIHGVERPKSLVCVFTVKDHQIKFETSFKLLSADFKIKAPDIIYRKVGQEVSIDANGILVRNK